MTNNRRPVKFEQTVAGLKSHAFNLALDAARQKETVKDILQLAKDIYTWILETEKDE